MIKHPTLINYIFGSPGAGKSTVLAMICKYYTKKGIQCYSNTPIDGAILIDDTDIGYFSFSGGVLLLDEMGVVYNNRLFKGGLLSDQKRLYYWKRIRHDHVKAVYLASQSWSDVDKKLRDLSTSYYLLKRLPLGLTVIKPIYKKVDIDEVTHEPADFFVMDLFFNWSICFRPLYYKMFDSYEMEYLPPYPAAKDVKDQEVIHSDQEVPNPFKNDKSA